MALLSVIRRWHFREGMPIREIERRTGLSRNTIRKYLLQTHEMLFDALTQAFRVLGGVPRRGIFDNMKTAVDRIGSGKTRQVNSRFAAMASHYLFEPDFCNPASGWEKGQVEKNVQDARPRLWQAMPSFPDMDALNAWLEARCIEEWAQNQHGALPGTIADVWAEEVAALMPPGRPFDGFVEHTKRVSPTCLINFERTPPRASTSLCRGITRQSQAERHNGAQPPLTLKRGNDATIRQYGRSTSHEWLVSVRAAFHASGAERRELARNCRNGSDRQRP